MSDLNHAVGVDTPTPERSEGRLPASNAPFSVITQTEPRDCAELDARRKTLANLRAGLALAGGYALHELSDGTFVAARWDRTQSLPDLAAVRIFARRVGAPV